MRTGLFVGLSLLGLLSLHGGVFGQGGGPAHQGVLMFCDDPSVEIAAHKAVSKFNEGINSGHILALYQIHSAKKSENGSDSLYSLKFTTRWSDCVHAGGKAWTDCDYHPYGRKEPFSCSATVQVTDTEVDARHVECSLDHWITPERASCMGCPEEVDKTSDDFKNVVSGSISKFNLNSDSSHLFSLHQIGPATRQVVAGFRYKFVFDMRKTTCAKAEHPELHDLCVHDEQDVELFYCNSTVDVAPWRRVHPETVNQCERGPMPQVVFTRRRPPGWTPLRKIPTPAPPAETTKPLAAKTPTKKESSEEETKAKKAPSSSPSASANPFHCPSNPWKPFNPIEPAGSAGPAAAEGVFSDQDLLG